MGKGVRYLTIVLALALILLSLGSSPLVVGEDSCKVVKEMYLVDLAQVVLTDENTTAWFETPINYSVKTYEQRAYVIRMGGPTWFDSGKESVAVNISNSTLAYIIVKIVVEYSGDMMETVLSILKNPQAYIEHQDEVPDSIKKDYIKTPIEAVNTTVREDFIKWLKSKGYSAGNASKAFLACRAAQFIYTSGYIRYSASPLPRTLDEVIERREGDCDDMSRILLNLLWALGIPAKMEYGYVYLTWSDVFDVGESYIKFMNAGPHAWVAAYISPLGWVSLDFLAGARLVYPAVITGSSTEGSVSKEEIEETLEFNIKVKYAEYVAIHSASVLPSSTVEVVRHLISEALHNITPYVKKIAEKYGIKLPPLYLITETVTVTSTSVSTTTVTETRERTVVSTTTSYVTVTEEVPRTVTETETKTEYVGAGRGPPAHVYATLIILVSVLITLLALNTYVLLRRRAMHQQVSGSRRQLTPTTTNGYHDRL
ncbi:MAG: transglutaminase family protein [Desulfurococcales archaeon]|nr:transglutaminase family protein [Desulfurococcales archaeon]